VAAACACGSTWAGVSDTAFVQEYRDEYRLGDAAEANDVVAIVVDDTDTVYAKTTAGVFALKKGEAAWAPAAQAPDFAADAKRKRANAYTPPERIPNTDIRCVVDGPDGRAWVGTALGVARHDGTRWSLRHSRRWLPSDDVRDLAFDSDGTAWVATAGGVSAIRRRMMRLEEKADFFLKACIERHVRPPYLVERCRLESPGDISAWTPEDDDNDGEYTSMYIAMESFRYAVTKEPEARANADKAFDALRFLQTVTETPGFIARSVVPSDWTRMHDGNRTYTEEERAEISARDPRYKFVETRWRPSKDGQWLWKGDTSSDEVTGHFYGFLHYYDLAADEAHREAVRDHVRKIMDYIIDNGYVLLDIDGTHTRWGVWAPERLNDDPLWRPERYVNSIEILAYLKTAHHITGDEKYALEYDTLLHKHGYIENIQHPKGHSALFRSHVDDELLSLTWEALVGLETDPELKALYRRCLDSWYADIGEDDSPFFNFLYGSLTGKDPMLDRSIFFLRDAPLDLVSWTVDNTTREDIELMRRPEIECLQTHPLPPPSERFVLRWDKNPWMAVSGDAGQTEWCPVYWLLPYWMGRYHGFIE